MCGLVVMRGSFGFVVAGLIHPGSKYIFFRNIRKHFMYLICWVLESLVFFQILLYNTEYEYTQYKH